MPLQQNYFFFFYFCSAKLKASQVYYVAFSDNAENAVCLKRVNYKAKPTDAICTIDEVLATQRRCYKKQKLVS
jgi:hypothetical protein